jgi:hypothetical protein
MYSIEFIKIIESFSKSFPQKQIKPPPYPHIPEILKILKKQKIL